MSVVNTSMPLGVIVHEHRDRIREIAERHRGRTVRVFGSVDAANQIASVIERGREAWDDDRNAQQHKEHPRDPGPNRR